MSNSNLVKMDGDKAILLMIRSVLAQQCQPGLSAAERQALRDTITDLKEMYKLSCAYDKINKALDWMDKQPSGFFQSAFVHISWRPDGTPAEFDQGSGVDWKALLAAGVVVAPFMMAAPALVPVLAAIEGIDAMLIGGAAAAGWLL